MATAASNNPLLTTLVAAVGAAELGDTLNSAEAITVFAPINPAFDALEAENPGIIKKLTTDPDAANATSTLSQVLTTHVVGTRYDADGLASKGTVASLQGSQLTIGGTAPNLTVSSGGVTASVVCANVPTANATVFLIDKVLMPAS
ncbi:MAG: fasciclin domain-containing protein [Pseudonocardiaceae bacterium]